MDLNLRFRFMLIFGLIKMSLNENAIQNIPEELYNVCRYSDICHRNASEILPRNNGKVPCCSTCSCREDCGLQLTCCFDHLDKYKLVESGKIGCIDATGGLDMKYKDTKMFGYYMVQQCNMNISETYNKTDDGCRLIDEFGHSLISPVSSSETDMIYINIECAACNNLDSSKLQKWNFVFVSDLLSKNRALTFEIEQFVENRIGTLIFEPPVGENWYHRRCYNKFSEIESCGGNKKWLEICQTFRAPFQHIFHTFRNVMCLICSKLPIESIDRECKKDEGRGPMTYSLSFLIDSSILSLSNMLDRKLLRDIQVSDRVCSAKRKNQEVETCLPIYCPEGMVKTYNDCRYFALKWFIPLITMQIELEPSPESKFSVSILRSLGDKQRARPFTWLRIPCRKINITTLEIAYSIMTPNNGKSSTIGTTEDLISKLKVFIFKKVDMLKGVKPSVIIPLYHRCLREEWSAVIGNVSVTFKANFYKGNVENGQQANNSFGSVSQRETYIGFAEGPEKKSTVRHRNAITITKPFFCQQVHIPKSDVKDASNEIHIISRNVSLGINEYLVRESMIHDGPVNETTYAVCIEDYINASSSDVTICTDSILLHIQMFVYGILFFSQIEVEGWQNA